jgi:hypothetical protein
MGGNLQRFTQIEEQAIVKAHMLLWHNFVEQHHEEPPKKIMLNFNGTDIQVRGG